MVLQSAYFTRQAAYLGHQFIIGGLYTYFHNAL